MPQPMLEVFQDVKVVEDVWCCRWSKMPMVFRILIQDVKDVEDV